MKLLIQRCKNASVIVDEKVVGAIQEGFLVFVGVHKEDNEENIDALIQKLVNLRVFEDNDGKINHSIIDKGYSVLSVSQYSLYADYKKGNRPSFTENANLTQAMLMYELFNKKLSSFVKVETGVFQANMQVSLVNDGPFTMLLDSAELRRKQ